MIRRIPPALFSFALCAACATTPPPEDHAGHEADAAPAVAVRPDTPELPPGADQAMDRLTSSPRHGEWVYIRTGAGDSIRSWVVYPERTSDAPVVLVVHEIYGLTAWIRSVADQLAADGFIAIAPDLMTMHGVPAGADGDPIREQATATIRTLDPAAYQRQLRTIADWGMALPSASDRYGIVGFCWGGSASFNHAVTAPELDASVVYYGSSPPVTALQSIRAPVLGLYGADDMRVNATVPPADSAMSALGKSFEYRMFEGAGHGFLRQQDGRDGANLAAAREAWPMTIRFFRQHLER